MRRSVPSSPLNCRGLDDTFLSPQVANPPAETGLTSTSLDRAPGPSKNFVRGKSGYVPFWPGGLEALASAERGVDAMISGEKGLRTVAPGLSRGLRLPGEVADEDVFDAVDDLEGLPAAVGLFVCSHIGLSLYGTGRRDEHS
jgi:hypothetical protein